MFVALTALLALFAAVFVGPAVSVTDDGAISLRHAERLSQGKGFSYNDGERVNAASDPLYVVLLAAVHLIVQDFTTSRGLLGGLFLMITACAGAILLLRQSVSPLPVLLYLVLFGSSLFLLAQYFEGLETGITFALITLLTLSMHKENDCATGIFLGLLVANKLDGLIAVAALVPIYALRKKKSLKKIVLWSFVAVAPVFAFLIFQFGSVMPQSLLSKLAGPAHNIVSNFDHLWMLRQTSSSHGILLLLFLLSLPALWLDRGPVLQFLALYSAVYLIAYSLIRLGDYYPWYLAPWYYLMIIFTALASVVYFRKLGIAGAITQKTREEKILGFLTPHALSVFVCAGLVILLTVNAFRLAPKQELAIFEKTNLSRAACGAWLRKAASPSDRLITYWGWPALEYKGQTIDPGGLTSVFDQPVQGEYACLEFRAGDEMPQTWNSNYGLHATFPVPGADFVYGLYSKPNTAGIKNTGYKLRSSDFTALNERQRRTVQHLSLPQYMLR